MIDTTGLTMWYKGYTGVLIGGVPVSDGGTIDQVENQISTTDALQTTAAARPTWHDNQVNGKGIIRFDGSNDFLSVANTADSDVLFPLTYFFAVKIPTLVTFNVLISRGPNSADQQYSIYINPPSFTGRVTHCSQSCNAWDSITENVWFRLIVRADTTSGGSLKAYLNGSQIGSTASLPTQVSYAQPTFIGKRVDGLFNSYDLAEMGVFNRNLSDQEIIDLDAYLAGVLGQ